MTRVRCAVMHLPPSLCCPAGTSNIRVLFVGVKSDALTDCSVVGATAMPVPASWSRARCVVRILKKEPSF